MSKATGEQPAAPGFIDGRKAVTPCGPTVAANFKQLRIDYIDRPRRGRAAAE
jgi:(E)-4-hydroxy-3-methylbut-2-enyl-diphosphate synthase